MVRNCQRWPATAVCDCGIIFASALVVAARLAAVAADAARAGSSQCRRVAERQASGTGETVGGAGRERFERVLTRIYG